MHCILEGVVQAHCREVLSLTKVNSLAKYKVAPAFSWPFKVVNPATDVGQRNEKELKIFTKQVEKIHSLLIAPIFSTTTAVDPHETLTYDSDGAEQWSKPESLVEVLKKNNMDALKFVCNDLNCKPPTIPHTDTTGRVTFSNKFNKIHLAQALTKWVGPFFLAFCHNSTTLILISFRGETSLCRTTNHRPSSMEHERLWCISKKPSRIL